MGGGLWARRRIGGSMRGTGGPMKSLERTRWPSSCSKIFDEI